LQLSINVMCLDNDVRDLVPILVGDAFKDIELAFLDVYLQ